MEKGVEYGFEHYMNQIPGMEKIDPRTSSPLVLAYCAVPGEADVYMIIEQALRYGKQVAIPRTFSEGQMEFYLLDSASSLALQTEQGAFGILEPLSSLPHIAVEKIPTGTLILVPLVAADHHCRRLGHGKGYYDRFLSRLHKNVHSCGCALSYQIVPHIPIQEHDQPLNYLATPSHLYTCDITS